MSGGFVTSAELAGRFGVARTTVNEWGRTWLSPAKSGRAGKTTLYNPEAVERLHRLHVRGKKMHYNAPAPSKPREKDPGLLLGVGEVASFLGVRPVTVERHAPELAPAVEIRGVTGDFYSGERVREIWRKIVHGKQSSNIAGYWDKVCPAPEGSVRGSRAAAAAVGIDRRTFMRNYSLFDSAMVCEKGGVRCYDPDRLREIWEEHMGELRKINAETARRTVDSFRPDVIPDGTVLGNQAMADRLGCCLGTISHHQDEFSKARISRHGRAWLYDMAVAEGIMAGIRRRQAENAKLGIARYWERKRLGLYTPSRNERRKAAKLSSHGQA